MWILEIKAKKFSNSYHYIPCDGPLVLISLSDSSLAEFV